jgi:glycerate 2-kinase
MAAAAHAALGERIQASLVSGPRGAVNLPDAAEWMASAHPLPDDSSVRAGARALAIARDAKSAGDPLLVLLSGGGSSMLCAPAAGISLADKRAVVEALMRRGADIGQVNCVRTHLSAIKGGRLAAAAGRSVTLAISDVHDPEDDPATIASGPTFGNGTRPADALAVLDSLQIPAPASVRSHLLSQSVAGEPTCVIASGETTVKVVGDGRGGRNQEFALGAAPLLARSAAVLLASAGTDGIDGPTDAAGAIVTTTTIARAAAAGVDIARALARNDAYKALAWLGDLIITGPTGTNVGDLHILLTAVSAQPAKRQLPKTQLPKPNSTGST